MVEVYDVEEPDIAMPMYNLLEYGESYANTLASLYQYCRDTPDDNITDSKSFKFKSSVTENNNDTKN